MSTKRLVLIILLGCQISFQLNNAKGQSSLQTSEANQIRCSIAVEDSHWSKGKPAYVAIRLENISDRDIKFWAGYEFYLTNMAKEVASRHYERVGDGYWSPAGMIMKDGQLVLLPNDLNKTILIKRANKRTTSRFPNEEIHLGKGEIKEIKVDLAQFLWEDRMRSVWPKEHFFDLIPTGKYNLEFEMNIKEKNVVANQIEVQVV